MKKITKKEFVEALTGKESIFLALDNNSVCCAEVIIKFVDKHRAVINSLPKRTCVKSTRLKFSDGSQLDVNCKQYKVYIHKENGYNIYALEHTWYDKFDDKEYSKTMYYMTK